ncbi:unnamed protein product [Thlaspi arvense]|uniref:Fe2OG dioxygenase domain-containing protein n=1 Tax=Thlaspi arvense TaxID=13288 RepID=A0AAU9SN28_THLAR|nr:unnamed protein product [Thlaspi arvense]
MATEFDSYSERKAFDETKAGVKGLVDAQITEIPRIFHDPLGTLNDKKAPVSSSDFAIPVIDFTGVHGDAASREAVVKKVKDAAENWGFFQVINHGVPLSVLDEIKDGGRKFHEEDIEVKKAYFSRDYSKKFVYHSNFNLYSTSTINWRDTFGIYMDPNPPKPEEIPEACRESVLEYSKHVMSLGGLLFELFSEALGLSPETLKSKGVMKGVLMLSHYYPPCPQPDLTLGASKHSDNSFVTLLLQDQIGGLQVLHEDCWVDVSPTPGALLVTNDKFISVQHRVLANKAGPRISVASFFSTSMHPNPTVYGPMKEILSQENPAKYRDFTIPEYSAGYLKLDINDESHLSHFKI